MISVVNHSNRYTLSIFFIILVSVGMGICAIAYPYAYDDYRFMELLGTDCDGPHWPVDWKHAKSGLGYLFYEDNIRLSNLLAIVMLLIPKWLLSSLLAIALGISIWFGAKSSGIDCRNWPTVGLAIFLIMLICPWWDGALTVDFQFNYIFPSLLSALGIYIFIDRANLPLWIIFITGLALGWSHEGFSAPVGVALFLLWTTDSRYRTKKRTIFLASGLFGLLILLLTPGSWNRAGKAPDISETAFIINHIYALLPAIIFFILSFIAWIKGKTDYLRTSYWKTIAIICLVSIPLKLASDDYRTVWCCCFFASFGIARLCAILAMDFSSASKKIIAIICMSLTTIHLAYACKYSFRESKLFHEMLEYQRKGTPGILYQPVMTSAKAPLILWGKPLFSYLQWLPSPEYYHIDPNVINTTRIVPANLREFTPEAADFELQSGGWSKDGYTLKPHTASPNDTCTSHPIVKITTPFGSFITLALITPFRSESDGTLYDSYIVTFAPPFMRPILDIKIIENNE